MKNTLYTTLIFILTIGCGNNKDKKEKAVVLSDSLAFYFAKADAILLSRKERLVFNQKSLAFVLKQKQDSLYFKNLSKIANNYYNIGELKAFKIVSKRIAEKAYQLDDKPNIAKAEMYLGDYYRKKFINDSAYLAYSKAETIYEALQDWQHIGIILLNKALLFYNEGNLFFSETSALKALTYLNDTKNNEQKYLIYNLLGRISNDQGKYDTAIEHYNKALGIANNNIYIDNKEIYVATSLNNLGFAHQENKEYKEAIIYFQAALKEERLYLTTPSLYATLEDNLAYSKLKLKDYSHLPDLFYKALAIRDSLWLVPGIVINKVHLSEYYQDQKEMAKAIQYAKEAYTIAKQKGIDPTDVLFSLRQLRAVDPSKDIQYASEYIRISDSIQKAQKQHQATSKLYGIIDEIAAEKENLILQKVGLEKGSRNLVILFGSLLFVGIILILLKRQRRENKEFESKEKQQELDQKIYNLIINQDKKIKKIIQKKQESVVAELRDNILNVLFGVRMNLDFLNSQVSIEVMGSKSTFIKELREITPTLGKNENTHNFIILVDKLLSNQEHRIKVSFTLTEFKEWEKIENQVKVHLYRILEEALENSSTHNKAESIVINMIIKKDTIIEVSILDDSEASQRKINNENLTNIQDRAEKMGGILVVTNTEEGMKIVVSIPVKINKSGTEISLREITQFYN